MAALALVAACEPGDAGIGGGETIAVVDAVKDGRLIDVKAFRIGPADPYNGLSPDVDIFLVGGTDEGDLVGVWTVSIET